MKYAIVAQRSRRPLEAAQKQKGECSPKLTLVCFLLVRTIFSKTGGPFHPPRSLEFFRHLAIHDPMVLGALLRRAGGRGDVAAVAPISG